MLPANAGQTLPKKVKPATGSSGGGLIFILIANRAMARVPPNAHALASPDNNTHSGI
jgi:hypothetical protein